MLAVEHIEAQNNVPLLEGRWTNFLLACVNCNSTKKDKLVDLSLLLFPDRDNTLWALNYQPDGTITPSAAAIANGLNVAALDTLELTGLNVPVRVTLDENGKQVALDRASQRMEAFGEALTMKLVIDKAPSNPDLRWMAVRAAVAHGFFSIWMEVFQGDPQMRNALIDAFPGTRASGCFDTNGDPVSPAPNPDGLAGGGKI